MTRFAIASLTPAALLALACLTGGPWPLLALLSITVAVFFLDRIAVADAPSGATGRNLSFVQALAHFAVLPLGVWAIADATYLGLADRVMIYLALGLYCGQISNSNAHELIHASDRWARRLGTAMYVSVLHGHHVSAHLRVHHIHAATDTDPNSARAGTGFYSYAARVLGEEFMAGLRADTAHRARARVKRSALSHPYVAYISGGILCLAVAFLLADFAGVAVLLAIALYAQMQLLLSDYVQHYGLRRATRPDGRIEPIGPQHSWNAPNWYSAAMMLNAPRHSDHHIRPARPFPALELDAGTMPILPRSLPVMAVLALVPPIWRRVMDRRVRDWQKTA
jgi:alkane 1-monooxygenase